MAQAESFITSRQLTPSIGTFAECVFADWNRFRPYTTILSYTYVEH